MEKTIKHDLSKVIPHFQLYGILRSAEPWGSGHINDTYRVCIAQGGHPVHYIIQRVNDKVFPNVPKLMENIQRVTSHICRKLMEIPGSDYTRETLNVVPSRDNQPYYRDAEGNYWRMYVYIEQASTFDFVNDPRQAYEAAKAFGRFQVMLMDLPGGPLFEVIPNFHNTVWRFEKFLAVLRQDSHGRAAQAQAEIEFCLARQTSTGTVVNLLASGELPMRVTHNDTKINNVMLDDADGRGLCVIDLDTVMPGSILYDFGDEVRTTTATAAEDERDLSKVQFRLDLFEQLVRGYLALTKAYLTAREIDLLAFSGRLITFEIGLRFLTDFLEGDVYFKTHRDGHNLDRCRTQFEMVRQMEVQSAAMDVIVAKYR